MATQWEIPENRVYNKPNGCSATGALAPEPDHHHHLAGLVIRSVNHPSFAQNVTQFSHVRKIDKRVS
jgi:hypothetical protein